MAMTDFHLLLLEDDSNRRASLLQAAERAGLGRVHALGNLSEARRYLERVGRTGERLPSLFLVNLDRPSGIEILSWLRNLPQLRRLVTIGLFDREDGQVMDRAYSLHVNSCLVSPQTSDEQVDLFRSLRRYWEGLNQAPSD